MDTTLQDPLVGQVLDGRYRIDARIAVGGMATVYRAVDTRLDRDLALKVMHPSLAANPESVDRFIREAKSVARLSHHNVVGVYDQGTDGTYVYLAMEYVAGCTLRDVLRDRGALQPRVALDILDPVLAALGAAHRAGLVHRDMKPENVLIGDDGRVKVADFGLARAVDAHSGTTDTILGTVSYLAPEQIEEGASSTRSDLYACGVMLYEMLTGAKPHDGATPAQVLYLHLNEPMPAPSASVPGLAPRLDALVARATARDPIQRPEDAVALLSEARAARASLSAAELDAVPPRAGNPSPSAGDEPRTSVLPQPLPPPAQDGERTTRLSAASASPSADGPRGRGGRRRGPRWVIVLLGGLLLALVGTGVWYINSGQFTQTPAVLDKTQAAAMKDLRDAGLDGHVTREYSEGVKRGHVIETSPKPGERIRHTGSVNLVISRGPHIVKVPDVSGTPLTDAKRKLRGAGLEAGVIKRKFDEETAQGSVIGTSPKAGADRRPGSPIALTVSKGAPLKIPDVAGDEPEAAKKKLEDAGLKVKVAEGKVFSSEDKGTVARQSPGEGGTVAKGQTVTLTLSKGPDMVELPDVGDMDKDEAKKTLEDAGFKVTVHRLFFGDTVFAQSPDAGEKAPRGSGVTLWVR